MQVDVLDFHGKLEPDVFQDWIMAVEDYFEWSGLSLDRQVRFVKMKLKNQPHVWWHSLEEHLRRLKQPAITDWDEMKLKLMEKYLPTDYEDSLLEELILLRQGNMTVDEYTNRFHELSVRSQIMETAKQMLARFKAGLRDNLQKELLTVRLISVEEAYEIASQLEQQMRTAIPRQSQAGWNNLVPRGSNAPQSRATGGNLPDKSKFNPISRWPPSEERKPQESVLPRSERTLWDKCYKCGGKCHYAVVCPTKDQKFTLMCEAELVQQERIANNVVTLETEDTMEEEIIEEEVLECSRLPLCVIRRILTGQRKEDEIEEDWLRTNIFHTRFEHKGKALNVVIYNGSGMNVALQDTMQKLKLLVEKHPNPYKLS